MSNYRARNPMIDVRTREISVKRLNFLLVSSELINKTKVNMTLIECLRVNNWLSSFFTGVFKF